MGSIESMHHALQPLDPTAIRRLIGIWDQGRDGPSVIVVAGIHGNEPAGYLAAARLVETLRANRVAVRGRVVAVGGNLNALRRRQRFEHRDLNRGWRADHVPLAGRDPGGPEDREQRELIDTLARFVERPGCRGTFIDLHSSSAPGPPFAILGDTLRNRAIAFAPGVPVILGLEELLDGTLIEFLVEHGHTAVAIEGGQHDAPDTPVRLEAALWLALEAAGVIDTADVPDREAHVRLLREASRDLPPVIEVRYRHAVTPADVFRMDPGFLNFDVVRKGQRVARDVRGDVRCPESGRILLPLYQGQGEDGFFIGRPVRRVWLRVSAFLRALRIDRVAPLLPGVRRDPDRPDRLIVDPRIARWFTLEIFHLFGYRHEARQGGRLHFSRRRPDHLPPESIGRVRQDAR